MAKHQYGVWTLDSSIDKSTLERLGDARQAADRLATGVGSLVVGDEDCDSDSLIRHGHDSPTTPH